MDVISSKDNNLIKEIKKLKEKRNRVEAEKFLAEGFRFVVEALQSDFQVETLIVSDKAQDRYKEFEIDNKLQTITKVVWASEAVVRSICDTDTPQGIVAVVKNKQMESLCNEGFYVLLDKLQDPGNVGTIIRTANAAGALGIIITKGTVDIYNQKTLRSTMGSIFKIPIIEDKELNVIKDLKDKGFKLIVSTLDTDNNFYDINMKENLIIAVGNEGNGISDKIYKISDEKVKIPMPGNAESLNVSIAAAIMVFEAVRQRNCK